MVSLPGFSGDLVIVHTKVGLVKLGGAMILGASSDAFIGATATISVGLMAAVAAIVVAWIQNRSNRARDETVDKVLNLTSELRALEHQKVVDLEAQLQKEREGRAQE